MIYRILIILYQYKYGIGHIDQYTALDVHGGETWFKLFQGR